MRSWLLVAALLLPRLAQAEGDPLERRVKELRALVCAEPKGLEKLFSPTFLHAVPPAKGREILVDYFRKGGAVTSVAKVQSKTPHAATYRFYTKTRLFTVQLSVGPEPPHLVEGLWFGPVSPRLRKLEEVTSALKTLPGQVSFAVCKLGGNVRAGEARSAEGPVLQHSLNPDLALALGSTFKLYVLGALVQGILAGKQRWDAVLPLRQEWKSWPSGSLHTWPAGAPVTLSTLAQLMISVSDNTATDHLLLHLGRPAVEAMLGAMGVKQPERTQPFLTTRESFLLHDKKRAAEYVKRDSEGRRTYLERVLAKVPWREHLDYPSQPGAIDQIEWFASASDLCRTYDWLRRKTAGKETELARKTLAINRTSLVFNPKAWRYIGYKGGSEPGVLNLSWLLQRARGEWLVLTAGWNDPKHAVDEGKLIELLQAAIMVLEETR
jgi:beta-lactamase class A